MSRDADTQHSGGVTPMPRQRSPRALDMASGLCVIAAGLLWVWPARRSASDTAPADAVARGDAPVFAPSAAPSARSPLGAVTDSLQLAVVNSNVFSATRRAPTSRFVVPGQVVAATSDMSSSATDAEAPSSDSAAASLPQLSGIVSERGERRALLQLLASDGGPRLYREGDVHAGYRIARIGADYVQLASRSGTRTVRLSPRESPDSLEMKP